MEYHRVISGRDLRLSNMYLDPFREMEGPRIRSISYLGFQRRLQCCLSGLRRRGPPYSTLLHDAVEVEAKISRGEGMDDDLHLDPVRDVRPSYESLPTFCVVCDDLLRTREGALTSYQIIQKPS